MTPSPEPTAIALVQAAAVTVGIEIPSECLLGVAEAFAEISAQSRLVMDWEAADAIEPAGVFQP